MDESFREERQLSFLGVDGITTRVTIARAGCQGIGDPPPFGHHHTWKLVHQESEVIHDQEWM